MIERWIEVQFTGDPWSRFTVDHDCPDQRRKAARFRAAGARYRFTHRCSSLTRLKAGACSLPASTLGEQRKRERKRREAYAGASIGPYFPRKPPSQSPTLRRVIAGYHDSQKRGRDSPFEILPPS